ncbi:type II restriction enzyme [Microcoleus sp. FACHB-672]|uniref:type II restriction enzyme n=1 Tax=Microcoleus sp. FACHB-672 TaxID=2692825 RepID=UPI001688EB4D|nr:translation elongation factor [Microcoleus sp. FACHB-672]MBD2039391.1 translation elongation factor [Microcoleus sp. FACHB-672]
MTKNDESWKKLFEQYNILEEVSKNGLFKIRAAQINEERESRLMAKFDHHVNLPEIFREHKLSILPISRNEYVIGHFDSYCSVEYNKETEVIPVNLPENIESIDYTNLYSESSALHCAFNIGIIDNLIEDGESTHYTVSGRMSTDSFEFSIGNLNNANQPYTIEVKNSQCEIDGGFESKNYFLLIEAKKSMIDDFLIRQLYYPYRLWSQKISKPVIPILMTYSNDTYTFFIYEFKNPQDYNSLILVSQKNYTIAHEEIQREDVSILFENIQLVAEPKNISIPQADIFEKVVDLLSLLVDKDLTKDEITENYQFDRRQTDYYTHASRYLGLIKKYKDPVTKKICFKLTNEAKSILRKRHKLKYLDFMKKILEHEIFYRCFELSIKNGGIPSKEQICEIMSRSNLGINPGTQGRRASTVRGWIEWIWAQI